MIQRKTCLGGIAAAAALLLAVTGCGKSYPAKNAAQKAETSAASESTEAADAESRPAVEQADFQLKPYAMDGIGCAVEVPDTFTTGSGNSAVSGRLSFDGTESDDAIVVAAYDAQPEEEFNQFQEDDLFELINFSTTLPQLQYFRETEIAHAENMPCKAFVGETLGTIAGEDTYVTILAVNCPAQDKCTSFPCGTRPASSRTTAISWQTTSI